MSDQGINRSITRSQGVAMRHDFAGLLQSAVALDNAVEI